MSASQAVAPDRSLASDIGRIARVLGDDDFPTGDRAALRRMTPSMPPTLTFYRFALRYLPLGWDDGAEVRKDWMTLVAGIALMSPGAHNPERGLGKVLAETGYSEGRLERLLSSEGDVRRTLLLRAARFLAAKSAAFNWVQGARFLLTRNAEALENLHTIIARDYYTSLEN